MASFESKHGSPSAARLRNWSGQINGGSIEGAASGTTPASQDRLQPERQDRRLLDYDEILATERIRPGPRDSVRRALLVVADVTSFLAVLLITRFAAPLASRWYQLLVVLGLWVLLNKLLDLYDWDCSVIDKSTVHELPRLALSVVTAAFTIFMVAPAVGLAVHRYGALEFGVVALATMSLTRSLVRTVVLRVFGPERALIIGSGTAAQLIARKLQTHPHYGAEVIGCVDDCESDHRGNGGPSVLGDLSCIDELCRDLRIERLVVAFSMLDHEHLVDAVRAGKALGVKVTVVPRLFEVLGHSIVVDDVEGMSVLSLRASTRTRVGLTLKRALDLAGAAVGLVLLAPLLALIALAIKLDSRGPVIFSQVRIGRGNKPFRIHKFRTMIEDAEHLKHKIAHLNEAEFPMLKIPEDRDPRLTRIGRLLRRTMLDELPQLWNVLRGEMSLVGPRPLEPQDDAEVIGWHRARLELTPGVTGPWQAMGRHAIPFREMLTLDYLYVADWSLWRDVKLLLHTVHVLARSRPS